MLKELLALPNAEAVLSTAADDLRRYGYSIRRADGDFFMFAVPPGDNGDKYLLVAHADTVRDQYQLCTKKKKKSKKVTAARDIKFNGIYYYTDDNQPLGGDDRAGVYIILRLIEKGLRPPVLITNYEEIGGLGVREFCTSEYIERVKDLYFFVEFDRRGINQYVTYTPAPRQLEDFVEEYGFVKEHGSYSDVKTLSEYTNIAHVNLSAGYINEHTDRERVYIDWVEYIIAQSYKMLSSYRRFIPYKQETETYTYTYGKYWYGNGYADYADYTDYTDFAMSDDDICDIALSLIDYYGSNLKDEEIKEILKSDYGIYEVRNIKEIMAIYKSFIGR